jgi:hypothetical protein
MQAVAVVVFSKAAQVLPAEMAVAGRVEIRL